MNLDLFIAKHENSVIYFHVIPNEEKQTIVF